MPELLPRFIDTRIADERKVAQIVLEAGEEADLPKNGAPGATSGGDTRRLRGLPAIGRGVQGAMQGTQPEGALIWKENGRRR